MPHRAILRGREVNYVGLVVGEGESDSIIKLIVSQEYFPHDKSPRHDARGHGDDGENKAYGQDGICSGVVLGGILEVGHNPRRGLRSGDAFPVHFCDGFGLRSEWVSRDK